MYLYLDTRDQSRFIAALLGSTGRRFGLKTAMDTKLRAGGMLNAVRKLLATHKIRPASLGAVFVEQGPGAFSSLRSGIIIANTMGFAYRLPVVGVSSSEGTSDNLLKTFQKVASKTQKFNNSLALPVYGREPSITKPRKSLG